MNRKCQGCGSVFQCVNPMENGYIRKDKIDSADYCERCFKIIHYGKTLVVDEPKDINSIIDIVNSEIKHSLFLVDLFNIDSITIDTYNKISKPKTLIISKSDIFKNVLRDDQIKNLLRNYYHIDDNIIFSNMNYNNNAKDIVNYLEKNHIKESYILGYINSGKSTLINKILELTNQEIKGLTTSYIPHTTMDFITITISDSLKLIDSPGFSLNATLTDNVALLKKINTKCHIKPITYQMKENDIIVIENLVNIKTTEKNSFTLYINHLLSHKKIYKPIKKNDKLELVIPSNSDLVIKGIGFINIKRPSHITINIEDKNLIEIRPSIFGGKYE